VHLHLVDLQHNNLQIRRPPPHNQIQKETSKLPRDNGIRLRKLMVGAHANFDIRTTLFDMMHQDAQFAQ
jgi:hypothetical protein